jgi:hypothetical protein
MIREHYVKWNNPGTEKQVPYDLTCVKSKKVDLIGAESRMVVTRRWGEHRGEKDTEKLVSGH